MFILDYKYVVGLGEIEYNVLLKLLEGNEDLTDDEERRVEQMHRTAIKVKKIRDSRSRMDRQRQRPTGMRVSPRRPVENTENAHYDDDGSDFDHDEADVGTESGFGIVSGR